MNLPVNNISLESIFRGLLGLSFIIFLSYILSSNRKAIRWRTVYAGLLMQLLLGIGVVYVPFIYSIFEFIGKIFLQIINFTQKGTEMVFGPLTNSKISGVISPFKFYLQ